MKTTKEDPVPADQPPPKPPIEAVQPADEELTPERVKAKLKQTRSACIQNAAASIQLQERVACSPASRGFKLPPKASPPTTPPG